MTISAKIILISALIAPFYLSGCSKEESLKWTLTFEDEFEGAAGESPDPSVWSFDIGTDWGNDQLEYDTDRPENVSLDGYGHLEITAEEESEKLAEFEFCDYTSGRIKTLGTFEQTYGRFEARIKLPVGAGIWPAFWLLGSNIDDVVPVEWPECGEIDIMEYRGQEPNILYGSLHGPGYYGGTAISRRLVLDYPLNAEYHVFSIAWSNNKITWMIDEVPYLTVTPADLPPDAQWVFNHPFFIILNVAVGGNFVGDPDESTKFPQKMLVDWVRVYRGD
ncbi:MAG: glycoside hydrolase family 16 protein [Candidatus Krumholzibacteriota bacterium]|nr:glycoside hydrolase family 16 protein [Candidatus Krumholzibacteriota bacterium]